MNPDKAGNRSSIDPGAIKIATRCCDDAADEESWLGSVEAWRQRLGMLTNDNRAAFHDGRAKALAKNDRDVNQEPKPDELGGTPVTHGRQQAC